MTLNATDTKALDTLIEEMRPLPGEWFVAKTKPGSENVAKNNLLQRIASFGLENLIYQVEVPLATVSAVKAGQLKKSVKPLLPGYLLVRMEFTDETWSVVGGTPGITPTGLLGATTKPSPVKIEEVVKLLLPNVELKESIDVTDDSVPATRELVPGSPVYITEGPFASMLATVDEVDAVRRKVTVLVSLFGRDTKVDLDISQVR